MENCTSNAIALKEGIEKTGHFNIVSKDIGVPLVAFSLRDSSRYTVFDIADSLRTFGWIVPAYTMPADAEHIAVLRVVVREDFSRGLAERLLTDIERVLKELDARPSHIVPAGTAHVALVDDGHVRKRVKHIQEDVTKHWKRFVKQKRNGVC